MIIAIDTRGFAVCTVVEIKDHLADCSPFPLLLVRDGLCDSVDRSHFTLPLYHWALGSNRPPFCVRMPKHSIRYGGGRWQRDVQ